MCCPHHQEEPERIPSVHEFLKKGKSMPGYAIDGGAAVHFKNGEYFRSIQFYNDSFVYHVSCEKNDVVVDKKEMIVL